jgi:hypothetical protein
MNLTISQLVWSFRYYVWNQSNIVHETGSAAIQWMCRQFVQCLVAWSSNNQDLCIYLQCPLPAFVLRCQVVNPTSVWVFTVGFEWRCHCTDQKRLSSSARWSWMCTPFVASDCRNHFLAIVHSMQYHCNTSNQDFHWRLCHWFDVTTSQLILQCLHNIFGQTTRLLYSAALLHALEILPCVCLQTHMMR